MGVVGVCPDCGYKFPLELALQDARAREALRAALAISPRLSGCIVGYLALFSPAKRAMRMDALAARLEELAEAISAAQVERDGQTWAAPVEYWREAMEEMLAKPEALRLPLRNHAYLFTVVAGKSRAAAGRKEQQAEQRARTRTDAGRGMAPVSDVVAPKTPKPRREKKPRGWVKKRIASELQEGQA